MGLSKTFKLSQLPKEKSLRFDVDFIDCFSAQQYEQYYTYKELFYFVENEKVNIDNLDIFDYVEIGNIEKNGDINPVNLSFDDRNEENENYFKKIEKGDILKPKIGDILISSIRPYLNKNILIVNENIYFTKAMIQIRPTINSKLFYYLLRTVFFDLINAVSRQGKGYPTLKEDDLKTIKFPKNTIDKIVRNEVLLFKQIDLIEQEIQNLKLQKKEHLEIINEIFADEFDFELDFIAKESDKKLYKASFIEFANDELKFDISLKYKSIFEKSLLKSSNQWLKLDKIVEVKGGKRLPKGESILEDDTSYKYIRVDDLSWSGFFDYDNIKYITYENHLSIKNYISNTDDILLTIVGATVGKCGIVTDEIDGHNITENFARLIIKDKANYFPQYVTYCLQSKICQLQVDEFTGKGSQGKLALFRVKKIKIPDIEFDKQQQIVEKIKSKIDSQKLIDEKIEQKQKEISDLIYQCIKGL